jgi:hypothetical protein
MKRSAPVALAVAAAIAVPGMFSTTPATAAPRCNPGVAAQLERGLPVTPFNLGRRLGQTQCFDFTGDGRRDIVFTGWEFMNHGAHYWAAFRATRTGWVRVKFKRGCCRANPRFGAGISIRHAGREIIVTEPVYAPDDPACCPSLGTKTGTWRWLRTTLGLLHVTREP